ncbi:tetratricopeptide repeat protein [Vulcanococcus limneticus]|uniref:tetratricopeptide repeat protein n=1 Tax=Vulcanococcus limneticus TaxID=2170428 RepID=UPI00398BD1B1
MPRLIRTLSETYIQTLGQQFRRQQWLALLEITRLAALVPQQAHPLELYYRGAALLHLGQLDEARFCLQRAWTHSPQDPRLAYFLGRTLLAQGDARGALPPLEMAYGQIPLQESCTAAYWYVRALLEAGEGQQATAVLTTALACHPNDRHLLGLRRLCQSADQPESPGPRGQDRWDAGDSANSCDVLLLIDGQTVVCTGHAQVSLQGQSLRLLNRSQAARQSGTVQFQLQGVVERPLSQAQGGYRFWARFQWPSPASEPQQNQAPGLFQLQMGDNSHAASHLVEASHVLDLRDQPWPQAAETCLAALQLQGVPLRDALRWLAAVIGPAMVALHRQAVAAQRRLPEPPQPQLLQFGPAAREVGLAAPPAEVAILIPLFRRWDFIRAQLSAFALDPSINSGRVQVLYICDDPSIEADLLGWCQSQGHHAGLPFQVLLQPSNQGFAASINQAARLSEADYLCLFNSDVLPGSAGWLELLLQAWRDDPEVAITTGLLLHPDGSLQHAGMESISKPELPGLRFNHHPGKGLAWGGGDQPQAIALCSGALMLVERHEFLELGGFRTDFIRGDFEDSDLCLRLQQRGRRCLLVPAARLWHGERQSMPGRGAGADGLDQWRVLTNAWIAAPRPVISRPAQPP